MSNQKREIDLKQLVSELDRYYVQNIEVSPSEDALYLCIPVDRISTKAGHGLVSEKQLELLTGRLAHKFSVDIKVKKLIPDTLNQIARKSWQMVELMLEDQLSSMEINFVNSLEANVWIYAEIPADQKKCLIENVIASALSEVGVNEIEYRWVEVEVEEEKAESESKPSPIMLMTLVKIIQPAGIEKYVSWYKGQGVNVSPGWVNRQLDKLIKRGLVVREPKVGLYSLTAKGMSHLPRQVTRNSHDVRRALELGRRKWSN